ncbi:MAG: hypothetical protein ACUVQ6_07915 [Dissulfurimicrobium sp.]|uniref:hypothetical protein n=1 Tax=Dissulfurimicrobium sp. TaxID=2022436 RepID=UPI00404B7279
MKKIFSLTLSLVAALMLAMWSSQASAITVGLYEQGALVPVVIHNGKNVNTVIGITLQGSGFTSTSPAKVCWAFFDVNSRHVTDDCFNMTSNDMYAFDWKKESGGGLENKEGYIAFASTATDPQAKISANAFIVDTNAHDAIYIPVLPLVSGDMKDIGKLTFEVVKATNGIKPMSGSERTKVDIRYWIDPKYDAETFIKLWSVCDVSRGEWNNPHSPGAMYTVDIYNTDEDRKSVDIYLKNAELNTIDPSTLQGRPTDFVDGFIRFTIPTPDTDVTPNGIPVKYDPTTNPTVCRNGNNNANNMLIFSYVDSSAIGAAQTMLAGEF